MANESKEKGSPLTVQELAAMGGDARAKRLSKKRRAEIASAAAKARWAKEKGKTR